ncbi:DUF4365 domain-containing protein [Rathayibacter sp. VKM Ac-2835]|uniref:DUF4365 domain-containing protein n=1 Tax=Rathayibacter sp. VKM Ac-2835 TaxID=2739043 RepID=UPI0015658A68|nr:DUF4365 domain-containing protein [Rathayibacter sp. VKM Ac-2835]NRG40126.1 DUF4365 domain-containing protein [Rathayibacter sp. VKM Ac-2835]
MTSAATTSTTLAVSHIVPDGSMPESGMKEELSKAFVHMLASAAGLDVGTWGQDFDVRDVTLKSRVPYDELEDAGIDVQLKCTGQESVVHEEFISWKLTPTHVEKLRRTHRATPYLLCVLVTEHEVGHWLHHSVEGLLARSHMYYIWGRNLPEPVSGQDKQTIRLPKANVLTPASLLELMEEASKWRPVQRT